MPKEKQFATKVHYPFVIVGVVVFFLMIFLLDLKPGSPKVTLTAAIAVLMAIWWVTEAIPIAVTSLLPIVLFPFLGIMDGKSVSNSYINYVIFLFIGGFIMALAMERWDLHKRIALKILSFVGGRTFMILFGFMFASAFLSMWMSNTATAMMMLPIAMSVLSQLEEVHGEKRVRKLTVGILLGIAYSCSIGGIATLVGTPPNLSFVRIFAIIFPGGPEISFGDWLIFAMPITAIMFCVVLLLLFLIYKPTEKIEKLPRSFFKDHYKDLGPTTPEQKRVLVIFIILVFLWVFRTNIDVGSFTIPGWSSLFTNPGYINDGTVAIFVAFLLFLMPSSEKNKGLVDWATARKIPWRIVLLFGGGFALAKGFVDSGLSMYIGEELESANQFSTMGLIGTLTGVMTGLTEFTSNTATTEMLLPIVSGLAVQIKVNPLLLMIPITLGGSMAFMFPIATPPNAIIYGSGKVSMWQMAKTGILINLVAIVIITLFSYFWAPYIFDINFGEFPDWAINNAMNATH